MRSDMSPLTDQPKGQAFSFGFADTALAEAGCVPLKALHFDAEAICQAYESIKPVAKRLGVDPPRPRLAGFTYAPLAALGARIVFPEDSEPKPMSLINSPAEIDHLREPEDYLAADLIQKRLAVARELKKRCPEASMSIGHLVEGPVTTAVLILGPDFFTLPYDDPERAHRLLGFSVRSALNYARAISEHLGTPLRPAPRGLPDDFAGIFPPSLFEEFVVPYWERMYQGLRATERHLHSELLRVEHLPFLKRLGIAVFDPSADQYLTPAQLRASCPARFCLRIQSWHLRDLSAAELQDMYRYLASYEPQVIAFYMHSLDEEPKIRSLLEVARQMRGG